MRRFVKNLGRYIYIYIFVCVCGVCLYLYLSLCLSICLPVYLSACLSIYLSLYAFMVLSPCLYLYVIILIYMCVCVCLSISIDISTHILWIYTVRYIFNIMVSQKWVTSMNRNLSNIFEGQTPISAWRAGPKTKASWLTIKCFTSGDQTASIRHLTNGKPNNIPYTHQKGVLVKKPISTVLLKQYIWRWMQGISVTSKSF